MPVILTRGLAFDLNASNWRNIRRTEWSLCWKLKTESCSFSASPDAGRRERIPLTVMEFSSGWGSSHSVSTNLRLNQLHLKREFMHKREKERRKKKKKRLIPGPSRLLIENTHQSLNSWMALFNTNPIQTAMSRSIHYCYKLIKELQ